MKGKTVQNVNSRHIVGAIVAGLLTVPGALAQDVPGLIPVPDGTLSLWGSGTIGEPVYENSYDPNLSCCYGQVPPGFADDLFLTRAGDLVSFTITVYNGSAVATGVGIPIDAKVQFYGADPVDGLGFPEGSLLAEYIVPIPAPEGNATVWTITTDLDTPVAVPQKVWYLVTTPDAIVEGEPISYAGPIFQYKAPTLGTTSPAI